MGRNKSDNHKTGECKGAVFGLPCKDSQRQHSHRSPTAVPRTTVVQNSENGLLLCVTEMNSREDIENLSDALREIGES